ncbi:hypothetical protein ACFFS2_13715 [Streptomyces aurantiacus]|uniref:LPXTG cell wall anchor domain-containing protein n=1 Tax=Streptomyces aurantiacus TaxID=47760 RepID=A0A7G1NW88_9ACTN|nr:hypothetical protein [Streptomyces aurantiacus]BCL25857.1 hypothetical protein GCM10017557_07160 [Streptomyces aurantiacus]
MPASPLSRSVGARTGAAALTTAALAGAALLGAPAAYAAPVDSGDVKIHSESASPTDQRSETEVCKFYLSAVNFEGVGVTGITWLIEPQPATSAKATLNGTLALPTGTGYTDTLALPDGDYKLTWKPVGGTGAGKEKPFKVNCKQDATGKQDAKPAAPKGPVPAGGGGLADTPTVSTAAAAGAVGLVGVSGFVYFRTLRRRPDGAA